MYVWSSSVGKGAVNRIVVNARLAVPADIPMRVTKHLLVLHRPYTTRRSCPVGDTLCLARVLVKLLLLLLLLVLCISRPQPASRTGGPHMLVTPSHAPAFHHWLMRCQPFHSVADIVSPRPFFVCCRLLAWRTIARESLPFDVDCVHEWYSQA